MDHYLEPESLSRRKFLKGIGTGLLGTPLLLSGVTARSQESNNNIKAYLQQTEPLIVTVNGQEYRLLIEPRTTLAELLRNRLHLTGTKIVCNQGECGGCTVLLNGKPVYSCQMLALDAAGMEVLTVEGLLSGEKLHPIQEAFVEEDGLQCGFCTPGQVMAAYGLLREKTSPSRNEVLKGMSGNICRCSAYPNIIRSVITAGKKMQETRS